MRCDKLKEGGMPQQKSAKGGTPQYYDSQKLGNRSSSDEVCNRPDELKDGGMPQCKMVTNIRHKMSPYKTLQDMLNDNVMKKSNTKKINAQIRPYITETMLTKQN